MRKITNTHTEMILSDTDMDLEYLIVGDYGKENNIKASFLGYDKRIDKVEHRKVDMSDKLVVTVSSQKGCHMNCDFCECPKFGFRGNASSSELVSEISTGIALSGVKHGKRLNVHFVRMREPTFNHNVILAAKVISQLVRHGSDIQFDEYNPVVSTMMTRSNKHLTEFLTEWVTVGYEFGGDDGFGLQFSINTLDEEDRNRMFRNNSLSL